MKNLETLSNKEVNTIFGGITGDGHGGGCIPNPLDKIGKPTFDPSDYGL